MTTKCGFCITGHHNQHLPSVTYYDRTWTCDCDCAAVLAPSEPKKRKTRSDKGKPRGPRKNPT